MEPGSLSVLGPLAAVAALSWTGVQLRRPARRRLDIAAVELLSALLMVTLLTGLSELSEGAGWQATVPPASLYALFGATLATATANARRVVLVWPDSTAADGTPLVAIASFAACSTVAASLTGAMLWSAEGAVSTLLVAGLAATRLYAGRPGTGLRRAT